MKSKRLLWLLFIVFILTGMSAYIFSQEKFGSLPRGKRFERIIQSPNYKNGVFKNQSETVIMTSEEGRFITMIKFMFRKKKLLSPADSIPTVKTNLFELSPGGKDLVWFGHSSYFIQIHGKRFLIDPVLSGHASPFSWMIKAFKGADVYKPEDIPSIDYLIITHDHWDHLDYETIMKLKPKIKNIICGLGVGAHFEYWGFDPALITELDWYEKTTLEAGLEITATPARHFSGRGLKSNQSLWASFVLASPELKLFLGGDGGYDRHFEEIGRLYGPFDLAIIEQGQYNLNWRYIHLLPDQLFKALTDLKAKRGLPVHHSKFALANHAWNEPLKLAVKNSVSYNIPLVTPMIGEVVDLSDTTQKFMQWWEKNIPATTVPNGK